MNNKLHYFITLLICLTACTRTDIKCTKSDAFEAESYASRIQSWDEMYNAFGKYKHCDMAAISEGFSDSIGKLLAYHWDKIDELNKLAVINPDFESFVIRHLDETIPQDILILISKNATNCSTEYSNLCSKILNAVK